MRSQLWQIVSISNKAPYRSQKRTHCNALDLALLVQAYSPPSRCGQAKGRQRSEPHGAQPAGLELEKDNIDAIRDPELAVQQFGGQFVVGCVF
jgi:hypothetical protein